MLDVHSLGFVCVCTPKRRKLKELAEKSWETHFKIQSCKNQKSVSLTSNMMKTNQVLWQAYAWLRATRIHVVASRNFIFMERFRGCHVSRGRCRILRFFKPPSSKTHPKNIYSTDVSFHWPWGQCPLIGCIYRWPWVQLDRLGASFKSFHGSPGQATFNATQPIFEGPTSAGGSQSSTWGRSLPLPPMVLQEKVTRSLRCCWR